MCVAAVAWRADPHWQLVLIGNRDEYHARAAAPLERWPESPVIAGALRLQAGQHSPPKVDVTPRWDMATLPAV